MGMENLIAAAKANAAGENLPPVEQWHPQNCANMSMKILRNGTWLHDGQPIVRQALIKLFSTILRKDQNGKTWLVTPVEKVLVEVEAAPFIAVSVDRDGEAEAANLFFTSNVGEVIRADAAHPIRVQTDPVTLEPAPFVLVRGRLEAMLSRPVFYQLVNWATEQDQQLGVFSHGQFFALGPAGVHEIG
ncbi:FIG003620: Proteophosphoglycan precursor (Fragment) [hydrothermal vent metagenome]|uniref:FIG003620: Proteophosphoglycan n=1 Tax=hydrothermal vent metagenome TaxID=652676 RepID=A0A3B0RKF0_9ZZZZ